MSAVASVIPLHPHPITARLFFTQANPPHLLSTVQYVDSFLSDALSGEDAYWWMQFAAATEFIKTIDERK